MISTTAKRGMVIALVAGFSFGVGALLVPPPEKAMAANHFYPTQVANCIIQHIEGMGSDVATKALVFACQSLAQ